MGLGQGLSVVGSRLQGFRSRVINPNLFNLEKNLG